MELCLFIPRFTWSHMEVYGSIPRFTCSPMELFVFIPTFCCSHMEVTGFRWKCMVSWKSEILFFSYPSLIKRGGLFLGYPSPMEVWVCPTMFEWSTHRLQQLREQEWKWRRDACRCSTVYTYNSLNYHQIWHPLSQM